MAAPSLFRHAGLIFVAIDANVWRFIGQTLVFPSDGYSITGRRVSNGSVVIGVRRRMTLGIRGFFSLL